MMLHTINFVEPLAGGHLNLGFDREDDRIEIVEIDLSPLLAQGGSFAPLHDPRLFNTVEIGPHGRTIFWRVDDEIVDLCADALWLMVHPEDAPGPTTPA